MSDEIKSYPAILTMLALAPSFFVGLGMALIFTGFQWAIIALIGLGVVVTSLYSIAVWNLYEKACE